MFRPVFFVCLLAARVAAAFGGTPESWLGGTQPWDSIPAMELNVGLQMRGGSAGPALGTLAEWGIFDCLMLAGTWNQPLDGAAGGGEAILKLREGSFPGWRPALAAYIRSGFGALPVAAIPGLVLAIEPWDHSLTANIESHAGVMGMRLGYWTPYLISFIRAGFEGVQGSPTAPWQLLPQVTFQAPGDLSAVLGAQSINDGSNRWSWLSRISFQFSHLP